MWKIAILAVVAAYAYAQAGATSAILDKGASIVRAATP